MELGIVEGFYGRPWSWPARTETIRVLAGYGYRHHLYAPKADHALRSQWREALTDNWLIQVDAHRQACQLCGISFGLGLSLQAFDASCAADRIRLRALMRQLQPLQLDALAVLFDDPVDKTAQAPEDQAALVLEIASLAPDTSLSVCPTWYSDDPLLDQVYGPRPSAYLSRLAAPLDQSIKLFWAGRKICAHGYTRNELEAVAAQIGRLPTLWDNYPVNDGPKMSPFLHLLPAPGRDPEVLGEVISAHFVNPAMQPVLTRIPAIALAMQYRLRGATKTTVQPIDAARAVVGDALARQLVHDIEWLQFKGITQLSQQVADKDILIETYRRFDHPAAKEILQWLDGYWADPLISIDTQPD